ncbi:MAG: hypothetical protein JO363_12935 [Solirubrobacterales bacterium]|nr:hypothetical protein [Solirubrobacterales bacterium]
MRHVNIPGFRAIDLMRRALDDGVEFATIMWFDDINAVKSFVGEDYETAHVPQRARNVLAGSTNARCITRSSTRVHADQRRERALDGTERRAGCR